MNVIWFANDTPLTETDDGCSVDASALGLVDAGMVTVPDQILVNGYSYRAGDHTPEALVYLRTHDGAKLTVNLK